MYESVFIFNMHFEDRYNIQLPKQMIFVLSLAKKPKSLVSPSPTPTNQCREIHQNSTKG
jgi:hypothetical protein